MCGSLPALSWTPDGSPRHPEGVACCAHKAGTGDGYVSEELGELYLAQGKTQEAAGHFAEAHRLLSQDAWLVDNEAERLARILKLSQPQ